MSTPALVCFSKPNAHPLAWLLNSEHRHVFVSVLDVDRSTWVSYDWRQGNPKIQFDAVADYDLESYWLSYGLTVLRVEIGDSLPWGPWMLNNCVGHTKLILGVRSWAVTPHGLYLSLTGQTLLDRAVRWLRSMTVVPGGGGSPPPPMVAPEGYEYKTSSNDMFTQTDERGRLIHTLSREDLEKRREGWYTQRDDQTGALMNPSGPDVLVRDPTQQEHDAYGPKVKASTLNPFRESEWTEGSKRELFRIPGYTTAGPMTDVGYRPGEEFGDPLPPPVPTNPTGAGGSTAASVPTPSQTPPPKPTSAEARRPPKRPSSKRPDTASGSSGASGSTIQADVTGGALASTQRSLIG